MNNLVICIFSSRDHKSSSKSHHKSSHSHGSSSKGDHHKDRHGDKRKHGSSSSSSKHHHKSAKKSRRWILESYQARIHFCCLKKDCQSFPNYAPQIIHTYVSKYTFALEVTGKKFYLFLTGFLLLINWIRSPPSRQGRGERYSRKALKILSK